MSDKIQIVGNEELEAGPNTSGMVRSQAFTSEDVWVGEVHTAPGSASGWHHHGDHITYGRVVSGRIRFDFGPGGNGRVEAGPGDFFMVPAFTVHREANPASEEQILVGVRLGSGPTVVNVDGPESGTDEAASKS